MKSCNQCKYAVFEDNGYSNYTVEGTEFECANGAHPDGRFDRFYGEAARLDFAEKCDGFAEGEPVEMDVDHDNEAELTPEQREIYVLVGKLWH